MLSAAQQAQQNNRDRGGRYAENQLADPGSTILDTTPAGPRQGQYACGLCGLTVLDRGGAWMDRSGRISCGDGELHSGHAAETVTVPDLAVDDRIVLAGTPWVVRGIHPHTGEDGEQGANLWLTDDQWGHDTVTFRANDDRMPRLLSDPVEPASAPNDPCPACGRDMWTNGCVTCGTATSYRSAGQEPKASDVVFSANPLVNATGTVVEVGWNPDWQARQFIVEMDRTTGGVREKVVTPLDHLYPAR